MSRKPTPTLTAGRPSRSDRADVAKARAALTETTEQEKRFTVHAPMPLHRKIQAIRSMSRDNVPAKYLVIEALEDLCKKYADGRGQYPIERQTQLERMLEELGQ
ncbi:MAG: hypothetical protein VX796_09235 [Pseudomonadota bacterium]|nr:hypothetical protein [Pseudomonadota bacterium]